MKSIRTIIIKSAHAKFSATIIGQRGNNSQNSHTLLDMRRIKPTKNTVLELKNLYFSLLVRIKTNLNLKHVYSCMTLNLGWIEIIARVSIKQCSDPNNPGDPMTFMNQRKLPTIILRQSKLSLSCIMSGIGWMTRIFKGG